MSPPCDWDFPPPPLVRISNMLAAGGPFPFFLSLGLWGIKDPRWACSAQPVLGLVVLNSTPLDSTKIPCLGHRLVGDLSSSSLRLALRKVLFNGVAQVLAGHQPSEDTADLQVQLLLWAFWDWNQQRAKHLERSCRTAIVDLGWHSQKCCVETGLFAILA